MHICQKVINQVTNTYTIDTPSRPFRKDIFIFIYIKKKILAMYVNFVNNIFYFFDKTLLKEDNN